MGLTSCPPKVAYLHVYLHAGPNRCRRVRGLRDDVVVTRVFNWTLNPTTARQIVKRKQTLYDELLGERQPAAIFEAKPFLENLKR